MFADLKMPELVSMSATITYQPPMATLYKFEGNAKVILKDDAAARLIRDGPLSIENILLRGSMLKDTDFIVGCAIYTGDDTKLSLNSKISNLKFSTVDKLVLYIYFLLI